MIFPEISRDFHQFSIRFPTFLAPQTTTAQAGAVATLCRALCTESAADSAVAEPGVKALQEICELPELRDAALEAERVIWGCPVEKISRILIF